MATRDDGLQETFLNSVLEEIPADTREPSPEEVVVTYEEANSILEDHGQEPMDIGEFRELGMEFEREYEGMNYTVGAETKQGALHIEDPEDPQERGMLGTKFVSFKQKAGGVLGTNNPQVNAAKRGTLFAAGGAIATVSGAEAANRFGGGNGSPPPGGNGTDTPTGRNTDTPGDTPTDGDSPTNEDSNNTETATAQQENEYQEIVNQYEDDVNVHVDSTLPFREQVREAAIKGAQQGSFVPDDIEASDAHIKAMVAVAQLDGFDYQDMENGDLAAPVAVYNGGVGPALMMEYHDPETGELQRDLLEAKGPDTESDNYIENWTEDPMYWGPNGKMVLNAEWLDRGFEYHDGPQNYPEDSWENTRELFSNLVPQDVGIMPNSFSGLLNAFKKVDHEYEGRAIDFFDDMLENAEEISADAFSFGYDEQADEFTVEQTFTESEYSEKNPYGLIDDWSAEEDYFNN